MNIPVLLVAGEPDAVFPIQKTFERLKRMLPHLDVKILPEDGQVLPDLASLIISYSMNTRVLQI